MSISVESLSPNDDPGDLVQINVVSTGIVGWLAMNLIIVTGKGTQVQVCFFMLAS